MAKKIKMLPQVKFKLNSGNMQLELDLSRFEKQFQRAQYELDSTIMTDMVPYMPMDSSAFINVTRGRSAAVAGSGKVVAAAPPTGRFLYNGKVMVGVDTRSAWAQKGEKKEVIGKNLQYSTSAHPKAQSHWFEAAKKDHGKQWISKVKKIAGGG